MNNSPFLGRFKVKATTTTKAFPPLKSALDMAFNATAITVLLACLHSYFRHNGFVEQGVVTLILFAIGAYVGYFISWYIWAEILAFAPRFNLTFTIFFFISSLASLAFLPAALYHMGAKLEWLKPLLDLDKTTPPFFSTNQLAQTIFDGLHVWWPTAAVVPFILAFSFYTRTTK